MKRGWLTFAGIGLALAVVAALAAAVLAAPRLTAVSPANGEDVPSRAAVVRLTFSRPVRQASLAEHVHFVPDTPGRWTVEGNTATFTPSQPWPAGETVTVTVESGLKAANGLALLKGLTWEFRTLPTMLAFVSPPVDGNIYAVVLNEDAVPEPLTAMGGVLDFAPSADGRFIYFSAQEGLGVSLFALARVPDEREETEFETVKTLVACEADQCLSPAPSPDGRWLAYTRSDAPGGGTRVHLLRLDDLTDIVLAPEHMTRAPMWSPQGRLAYYDDTRLGYVVVAPESGKEIAFISNDVGEQAAWAPDGHALVAVAMKVVHVSSSQATPDAPSQAPYLAAHLWLYRFSPQVTHIDLTSDPNLEDASPAFSPDGAWLAFARKSLDPLHWTPGRQFWLMHPDGSDARQITRTPDYNYLDFVWHPTQPLVAYARTNQTDLTQPPEVWVYDVQRGTSRWIADDAVLPRWLP